MRAANRDGPAQAHQFRLHLSPAHDRDVALRAATTSRLSRRTAVDVTNKPERHLDFPPSGRFQYGCLITQAQDIIIFCNVGALHLISEQMQNLGDARHANATNTDKMQGANREGKRAHVNKLSKRVSNHSMLRSILDLRRNQLSETFGTGGHSQTMGRAGCLGQLVDIGQKRFNFSVEVRCGQF